MRNDYDEQRGEIIATSGHEETVLIAEIDYSQNQLQRGVFYFKNYYL